MKGKISCYYRKWLFNPRGIFPYKKHTEALFDKESGITDIVATITPSTKTVRDMCEKENLPKSIDVRFVQVILDDGEVEVLATSILDPTTIAQQEFKALYFKRWK